MYTNIRGLRGKKASLMEILHENRPHLFLLTETQLRCDTIEKIDGYTFFSRKRENKVGGGVGILVRNDICLNTAPHISERSIEIIWVSIRRKGYPPFLVGTYYGKQETRTNKNEIEHEMHLLTEEIQEMKKEGEILLIMDGNAKIGLLNETTSRNGSLLKQVFEYTGLSIINNSNKCTGRITRKNTKRDNEFSAIDFILADNAVKQWIVSALIDEDGLFKVRGKNETDHNTICVDIAIPSIAKKTIAKHIGWNIGAPEDKWEMYREELANRYDRAAGIITDKNLTIEQRYTRWFKEIDDAARNSIGKTTFKAGKGKKPTKEMKELRQSKRKLRKDIKKEEMKERKALLIQNHQTLQETSRQLMIKEKIEEIQVKLDRIIRDKTGKTFWKEKKTLTRNPALELMVIKDANGHRQYTPDAIKETTANYYENLYKWKEFPPHPYHQQIEEKMTIYTNDRDHEIARYNREPSIEEITEIINCKKNGKSTPDIKNEMLKKPGEVMINFLLPLIKTIWEEETIPSQWNTGNITSLWKGKGDKEDLHNYRGVTTSSAIGTIFDALIDHRIESVVPFTQAQGGGKQGSSTCDHLLLLRSMIDIAIKQKRATFLTFYDVSKAYDNVNNDDMLTIMWDKGLRGKSWRILKNLNSNLRASMKTKYGPTREIEMEIGGKQGSRLTGRMFSKLMDMFAEELEPTGEGFAVNDQLTIATLLWVDDVVSSVDGTDNQLKMLQRVQEFSLKHRLRWGQSKCKVMRIGKPTEWELGKLIIQEATSYKYLGDLITNDGKNGKNIELRKNKTQATTVTINGIAASEVLRGIESTVLIELHEKITVAGLLTNAESWSLNRSEKVELERIEIQALKNIFDLPTHTPTPAILYTLGTLYTNHRVDKKRFIYLHRILNRNDNHWTKIMLHTLERLNIGWGKSIKEALDEYDLSNDFTTIKNISRRHWTKTVAEKIETINKKRLIGDCHKNENGIQIPKTKTAHIVSTLANNGYERKPQTEITQCTKQETKTLIIARFGMLECGRNYKGSMNETCTTCNLLDDENHRLNFCIKYREHNFHDSVEKEDFKQIFSEDIHVLRNAIHRIEKVWNIKTAHGTMKN